MKKNLNNENKKIKNKKIHKYFRKIEHNIINFNSNYNILNNSNLSIKRKANLSGSSLGLYILDKI